MPVVIGGNNLPTPVGIGLTDLTNIGGGGEVPPWPPQFQHHCDILSSYHLVNVKVQSLTTELLKCVLILLCLRRPADFIVGKLVAMHIGELPSALKVFIVLKPDLPTR